MSKKATKLVGALLFLSTLVVTSGQNKLIDTKKSQANSQKAQFASYALIAEMSQYGSLVGLKDTAGKDLFKQIPKPWHEGFAIAYKVKNPNGNDKEQFVYVIGDQVSSKKLKLEPKKSTNSRRVITTKDKVLEIGRSIIWDEKSNELKSEITVANIGMHELALTAFEIEIDERMVAWLRGEKEPRSLTPEPGPLCEIIKAGLAWTVTDEYPTCPCGNRCDPPQARAFFRKPMTSEPAYAEDPLATQMPLFKYRMLGLGWAGSNLAPSRLAPGQQIVAHYWINIPQR